MAMGFPQSTYSQQRALSKNVKKENLATPIQTLEANFKSTLAKFDNTEENTKKSFVEMVVNYVVHFFAEKVVEQKVVNIKCFDKHALDYVAIKKDFEYQIIG